MDPIAINEATAHFSEIVDQVISSRESVTITRDGAPLVNITPAAEPKVDQATDNSQRAAAIAELRKLRSELTPMRDEEIQELIAEGRQA